jgi:hypothetical protein
MTGSDVPPGRQLSLSSVRPPISCPKATTRGWAFMQIRLLRPPADLVSLLQPLLI